MLLEPLNQRKSEMQQITPNEINRRLKISLALRGRKNGPLTEEHRLKLVSSHRGMTHGTKNLIFGEARRNKTWEDIFGHKKASLIRQKLKEKRMIASETRYCACGCKESFICKRSSSKRFIHGHNPPWNKGLKTPEHTIKKIRSSLLGFKVSEETQKKISLATKGSNNPMFGVRGPLAPNWQGGKSFQHYPLGWTRTFKEQIRYRDGYVCQICGIPEAECINKLSVHHIDYNKHNLDHLNLISLCNACHYKTNHNRSFWMDYFKNREAEFAVIKHANKDITEAMQAYRAKQVTVEKK